MIKYSIRGENPGSNKAIKYVVSKLEKIEKYFQPRVGCTHPSFIREDKVKAEVTIPLDLLLFVQKMFLKICMVLSIL